MIENENAGVEELSSELEKLQKTNKRRKILLIVLICLIAIVSVIIGVILIPRDDYMNDGSTEPYILRGFNSKFDSYTGKNRTGSMVKQLCTNITSNNVSNSDDENKIVYIKMGDITGLDTREKWKNSGAVWKREEITTIRNAIISGAKYDVIPAYDEIGLIVGIGIIEVESSNNTTQNTTNTTMNSTEPKT